MMTRDDLFASMPRGLFLYPGLISMLAGLIV